MTLLQQRQLESRQHHPSQLDDAQEGVRDLAIRMPRRRLLTAVNHIDHLSLAVQTNRCWVYACVQDAYSNARAIVVGVLFQERQRLRRFFGQEAIGGKGRRGWR